jgi:predicted metal-dependent enzyme (double-stranded beta helix superfamily)
MQIDDRPAPRVIDLAPDRDLSRSELQAVVADLALRPEVWRHRVEPDPEQRTYQRLVAHPHLSVYLICWMTDHDTGFHDHDVSSGAVAVVEGAVREERLAVGGPPRARTVEAGGVFDFAAADIHRVLHGGGGPAVTIHAYSPELTRMGAYEITPDGTLQRHSVGEEQELRAHAEVPRAA